jgi:hypothetical protein
VGSQTHPRRAALKHAGRRADTDAKPKPHLKDLMLRIDETSKTLVAPQASAFVTEAAPDQHELLALVSASWEAFAGELGHGTLRFLAAEPTPGVDVLAFDESTGRVVLVTVLGQNSQAQLMRAITAAGMVAGWDAAKLADVHHALHAAVPGDTPELVLVAGDYDPGALAFADWLVRRHGFEIAAYAVAAFRFGAERLLSVRRVQPNDPGAPVDPADEVRRLMFGEIGVATSVAPPS